MEPFDPRVWQLIQEEGLDDFETLLHERSWDEVPFVSRLARIDFLRDTDALEKTRFLVVNAVRFARVIRSHASQIKQKNFLLMVSITSWEYRDGAAEVSHIHLDGRLNDEPFDLTVFFKLSKPPLTPEEAAVLINPKS